MSTDALKMLWYARLHPNLKSKWIVLIVFVNVFLSFLIIVLAVKGITLSYNDDLFFMSECLQSCILLTHVSILVTIYTSYYFVPDKRQTGHHAL